MKLISGLLLALTSTSAVAQTTQPLVLYRDLTYGMKQHEAPQLPAKVDITPTCQADLRPYWDKSWKLPAMEELTEQTYLAPNGKRIKRLTYVELNVTLCNDDEIIALLTKKYGQPTNLIEDPLGTDSRKALVWYSGDVEIKFASYITSTVYYKPHWKTDAL